MLCKSLGIKLVKVTKLKTPEKYREIVRGGFSTWFKLNDNRTVTIFP